MASLEAARGSLLERASQLGNLPLVIRHDLDQKQVLLFDQECALARGLVADYVEQLFELAHAEAERVLFFVAAREMRAQRVQLVCQLGVRVACGDRAGRNMLEATDQESQVGFAARHAR